jgi:hypothetical protein
MRNGYEVHDSDTHIGPSADTLEKYLASRVRALVPDLESRKVPQRRHSAVIALSWEEVNWDNAVNAFGEP